MYKNFFSMSKTPSPPASSNEPKFNVKQLFRHACNLLISNVRSWLDDISHSRQRSRNSNSIASRVSLSYPRSRSLNSLPAFTNDVTTFDIESQCYQLVPSNKQKSHGKTILGLTFQTVLTLALNSSSQNSSSLLPLNLAELTMVIAFAAFFIGICLSHLFPRLASTFDKISSVLAAMGFFFMTTCPTLYLPSYFRWTGWLAFALCMWAYIMPIL